MTYFVYVDCELVAQLSSRARLKAFMTKNNHKFAFVVRSDGLGRNCFLQNDRLRMS